MHQHKAIISYACVQYYLACQIEQQKVELNTNRHGALSDFFFQMLEYFMHFDINVKELFVCISEWIWLLCGAVEQLQTWPIIALLLMISMRCVFCADRTQWLSEIKRSDADKVCLTFWAAFLTERSPPIYCCCFQKVSFNMSLLDRNIH